MFKAFDLKISEAELQSIIEHNSVQQIQLWKNIGWSYKQKFDLEYDELLHKYVEGQILDGTKVASELFSQNQYDVFLSYSHDDENFVLAIAGMLINEFGLKVFVDSYYWGSADGLLKKIDDVKCKRSDGTYDYYMRNLSTSHVHAMLTAAIIQIIDSSELVLFLNTRKSVPILKNTLSGKKEYTFSPWIYEEILFTTLIRERNWTEYRIKNINEKYDFEERAWNIAYELPKDKMLPIIYSDLWEWIRVNRRFNKSQNRKIYTLEDLDLFLTNVSHHPLNILYMLIDKKIKQ